MQIHDISISLLREYDNNPRNNDGAVDAVAKSIREFGFKVPVVVDTDNVIVCGHTRVKAARELGMETVPCIIADDLTPEQIRAFRLADNKVGELAGWEIEKLGKELSEIDMDMSVFGFDAVEFEEFSEVCEDEIPDVDEEGDPITKLGDIWQLGRHRLMCGDSTSVESVAVLMDGALADMILTDPPYNVAYEGRTVELIAKYKSNDARYGYNKDNGGFTGCKISERTKAKMSDAHKGQIRDAAYRQHIAEAKMCEKNPMYGKCGELHHNSKTLFQKTKNGETIRMFKCVSDAERCLGLPHGAFKNISACALGKKKTAYGFVWCYYE